MTDSLIPDEDNPIDNTSKSPHNGLNIDFSSFFSEEWTVNIAGESLRPIQGIYYETFTDSLPVYLWPELSKDKRNLFLREFVDLAANFYRMGGAMDQEELGPDFMMRIDSIAYWDLSQLDTENQDELNQYLDEEEEVMLNEEHVYSMKRDEILSPRFLQELVYWVDITDPERRIPELQVAYNNLTEKLAEFGPQIIDPQSLRVNGLQLPIPPNTRIIEGDEWVFRPYNLDAGLGNMLVVPNRYTGRGKNITDLHILFMPEETRANMMTDLEGRVMINSLVEQGEIPNEPRYNAARAISGLERFIDMRKTSRNAVANMAAWAQDSTHRDFSIYMDEHLRQTENEELANILYVIFTARITENTSFVDVIRENLEILDMLEADIESGLPASWEEHTDRVYEILDGLNMPVELNYRLIDDDELNTYIQKKRSLLEASEGLEERIKLKIAAILKQK